MTQDMDRREALTRLGMGSAIVAATVASAASTGATAPSAARRPPQVFGVGGKFFVEAWERPLLQQHLLSLAGVASPRICLLQTATGDNPYDIERFYRDLGQLDCRPTHLSLMAPTTLDFERYFKSMDIIYVGGGATKNLMAMWPAWGVDQALRAAWLDGVVLAGNSAGSICWFESCITDSYPPKMRPLKCTGFLKGSACTHYDERPDRPTVFRDLIARGVIDSPGYATENHVALHFIGTELHEIVSARQGASAFLVKRVPSGYLETKMASPRFLG